MKRCPDCRHVIHDWQMFCPHCSAELHGKREKDLSRVGKKKLLSF